MEEIIKMIRRNEQKIVHVKAFGVDVPMKILPGQELEPVVCTRIFRDMDGKTYMDTTGTAQNVEDAKKVGVPCDLANKFWTISFKEEE